MTRPPAWILAWPPVGDFVRRVNSIELPAGVRVNVSSWWRDPAYNDSLPGAARDSQHIVGLAIDTTPHSDALISAALRAGLVASRHGSHDHIQRYQGGGALVARAVAAVRAHFAPKSAPVFVPRASSQRTVT